MSLEIKLNDLLKESLKGKDQTTADVVRMLKTKVMERRTAKGFTGTVDDALILDVIAAYKKQLGKAIEEFEKLGEKGAAEVAQLRIEVKVCERFLPAGLAPEAVEALVKERIATLGITDQKGVGKLLGDIMKTHKGLVEANDVKKIAATLLP